MALTHQQIDILFEFTRKKSVRYYDLQIELVDHLASSIEDEMAQNKTISFEQALQKVYAGFGIFGFAHVVQEKQIALEKQHRKLCNQTLMGYFTFPNFVLTTLVFLSSFQLSSLMQADKLPWVIYILLAAYAIIIISHFIRDRKATKKKLLLMQFDNYFMGFGLVFPYLIIMIEQKNSTSNIVFAILATAIIINQLAIIQINRQIRKKAMELYPEAFATA